MIKEIKYRAVIVFVIFLFFSINGYSQASGGQITRNSRKTPPTNTSSSSRQLKKYAPIEMEPKTYYMCINETWVIKNGQDLCRKMAAKGYDVELLKDPNPSMGYHVSVYKTKNKDAAISFYNSFSDARWNISYPFYDREYLPDFLAAVSQNNANANSGPFNEKTHKVLMKVKVSSARYNNTDISNNAVSNNQCIIIYTTNDNDLNLANYLEKAQTQSWGPLKFTDSKEIPESSTQFRKVTFVGEWEYHNTYNNNTGKCQVTVENIYNPGGVFSRITLDVDKNNRYNYSGDVSFIGSK